MEKRYTAIECEPGQIIKKFTEQETQQLEKEWMRTFCKKKQGVNTKAYKWHIFSSGIYPSVSGEEAREVYSKHEALEYIVLPNDHELAILTDTRPIRCHCSDYYVFPQNMAWTMAFTHEEGWLGPYFAQHPEYESRHASNLARIRKEQEKAYAREQGRCS